MGFSVDLRGGMEESSEEMDEELEHD